ncbi:MAG: adenylosuccinate lyase [Bellilinea sp.]
MIITLRANLFPQRRGHSTIKPMSNDESYQSPFSWRYGSAEMRRIWSERNKRLTWRRIWLALAETQAEFGLVSAEQTADLRGSVECIDLPRALQIEAEIHHDLMAELKTFAEQAPLGGAVLHLGATSTDIEDNADALRIRAGLDVILARLDDLLAALAERIEQTAAQAVMGFTHLQPAEPTTLGYRLAFYGQDLLTVRANLRRLGAQLRGKGLRGAVGTSASYADLLGSARLADFEQRISRRLGLEFYPVTSQVAPRLQEYHLVSELAGLAAVLSKFAIDLRFLQSPPLGEWQEPFAAKQVGSSAMPFKRNPILAEKIDSLARLLASLPSVAWGNCAFSLLERTLDDSANRRSLLPEAFLAAEEILLAAGRVLRGLVIHNSAVQRNLRRYAPFAATERVLMALARRGGDRQAMHERLRGHSLAAWQALQSGQDNPLRDSLKDDPAINALLTAEEIERLMAVEDYLGDAPQRALALAAAIRASLAEG